MAEETYKPGDKVPKSGIYRVIHDENHHEPHEITVVFGDHFPPCNHCGKHPRFVPVRLAQHVSSHKHFK
jgi:hypothetical protein